MNLQNEELLQEYRIQIEHLRQIVENLQQQIFILQHLEEYVLIKKDGISYTHLEEMYFIRYLQELSKNDPEIFLSMMGCHLFERSEEEIENIYQDYRRYAKGRIRETQYHVLWTYLQQEKQITYKQIRKMFHLKENTTLDVLVLLFQKQSQNLKKQTMNGKTTLIYEEKKHD